MRLYLIRHGESVWNVEDRIQGHGDSPLTAAGLEQSALLARHLAGKGLAALYASPLQRAHQTAQAVAEAAGLSVTLHADLREIALGVWEGLTPAEVNARFENGFETWRQRPTQVVIPGSEPIEQFRRRAVTAITTVVRQAPADAVGVVTHGGVIAAYLSHVLDADFDYLLRRLPIHNTGVTILERLDDEHPAILAINDLQHLNVAARQPRVNPDDLTPIHVV